MHSCNNEWTKQCIIIKWLFQFYFHFLRTLKFSFISTLHKHLNGLNGIMIISRIKNVNLPTLVRIFNKIIITIIIIFKNSKSSRIKK